jgi:hypothetical protein
VRDKWLMVVIGWGIVGPVLAIGASYVLSCESGQTLLAASLSALRLTASSALAPGSPALYGYSFVRTPHANRHDGQVVGALNSDVGGLAAAVV